MQSPEFLGSCCAQGAFALPPTGCERIGTASSRLCLDSSSQRSSVVDSSRSRPGFPAGGRSLHGFVGRRSGLAMRSSSRRVASLEAAFGLGWRQIGIACARGAFAWQSTGCGRLRAADSRLCLDSSSWRTSVVDSTHSRIGDVAGNLLLQRFVERRFGLSIRGSFCQAGSPEVAFDGWRLRRLRFHNCSLNRTALGCRGSSRRVVGAAGYFSRSAGNVNAG